MTIYMYKWPKDKTVKYITNWPYQRAVYLTTLAAVKGLKRHLHLLSFKLTSLTIQSNLTNISLWSFPCSLKPVIQMSSAIPKTFHISLNVHLSSSGTCLLLVCFEWQFTYLQLPDRQKCG